MSQMLSSPEWWFSSVLVAMIVNIASHYLIRGMESGSVVRFGFHFVFAMHICLMTVFFVYAVVYTSFPAAFFPLESKFIQIYGFFMFTIFAPAAVYFLTQLEEFGLRFRTVAFAALVLTQSIFIVCWSLNFHQSNDDVLRLYFLMNLAFFDFSMMVYWIGKLVLTLSRFSWSEVKSIRMGL